MKLPDPYKEVFTMAEFLDNAKNLNLKEIKSIKCIPDSNFGYIEIRYYKPKYERIQKQINKLFE